MHSLISVLDGQLHAPASLTPKEIIPSICWMGGWVSLKAIHFTD